MKIYGPYTRKDGRQHIIKYENGKRTTQSYPRYLMEQKLGRELLPNEHVDHIDEDFTNNVISNLQILTQKENNKKHFIVNNKQEKLFNGICSVCGISFTKPLRYVKHNQGTYKKSGPFCSRSCAGKHNAAKQYS